MPWRLLMPPPPVVDPRATANRVNRAMFFLGAALFMVGLRFFATPEELARTSIGRTLPGGWDEAWSLMYLVGGLLIMAGIATRHPRVEMPGLTLAFTATMANGAAIIAVLGLPRSLSQLPLYVIALWVIDGRIRDLRDLPRDRRRGNGDDRLHRVERRVTLTIAPVIVLGVADPMTGVIVALLGGGIVTALVQAFLYRPQRRDLEARLSKTAVEAADIALRQARNEAADLRREVDELRGQLRETRHRCDVLERALIENGIPVPS